MLKDRVDEMRMVTWGELLRAWSSDLDALKESPYLGPMVKRKDSAV